MVGAGFVPAPISYSCMDILVFYDTGFKEIAPEFDKSKAYEKINMENFENLLFF